MSSEQTTDKKRTTLSMPHDIVDEIDEFSEEQRLNSRSKAVEVLAAEALEQREKDETQDDTAQADPSPSFVEALATRQAAGLAVLPFIVGCTVFAAGAPFANSPVAAAAVLLVGGALLVTSTAAVWAVALAHVTLHGLPSVLAVGGGADG